MSVLEVKGLTKIIKNTAVLKDVHLMIDTGEVLVIFGPAGSGKSTLLRCMSGLEAIDGGELLQGGRSVNRNAKDRRRLQQAVELVRQNNDLSRRKSVLEYLIWAPVKEYKRDSVEVTHEAVVLLERVGLVSMKDISLRALNLMQWQQVKLLRSALLHPRLLLVDELTDALDPEMAHEVLRIILELAQDGMTMAVVTHDLQFARAVADRVVLLDKGSLVEEGSVERFFRAPQTERARQFLRSYTFTGKERPAPPNYADHI